MAGHSSCISCKRPVGRVASLTVGLQGHDLTTEYKVFLTNSSPFATHYWARGWRGVPVVELKTLGAFPRVTGQKLAAGIRKRGFDPVDRD